MAYLTDRLLFNILRLAATKESGRQIESHIITFFAAPSLLCPAVVQRIFVQALVQCNSYSSCLVVLVVKRCYAKAEAYTKLG